MSIKGSAFPFGNYLYGIRQDAPAATTADGSLPAHHFHAGASAEASMPIPAYPVNPLGVDHEPPFALEGFNLLNDEFWGNDELRIRDVAPDSDHSSTTFAAPALPSFPLRMPSLAAAMHAPPGQAFALPAQAIAPPMPFQVAPPMPFQVAPPMPFQVAPPTSTAGAHATAQVAPARPSLQARRNDTGALVWTVVGTDAPSAASTNIEAAGADTTGSSPTRQALYARRRRADQQIRLDRALAAVPRVDELRRPLYRTHVAYARALKRYDQQLDNQTLAKGSGAALRTIREDVQINPPALRPEQKARLEHARAAVPRTDVEGRHLYASNLDYALALKKYDDRLGVQALARGADMPVKAVNNDLRLNPPVLSADQQERLAAALVVVPADDARGRPRFDSQIAHARALNEHDPQLHVRALAIGANTSVANVRRRLKIH